MGALPYELSGPSSETPAREHLHAKKGTTLIELVVVIVILGILGAIAVPSYLSLRQQSDVPAGPADLRAPVPTPDGLRPAYDRSLDLGRY